MHLAQMATAATKIPVVITGNAKNRNRYRFYSDIMLAARNFLL
jgi:hypothetical protein